MGQSQYAMRKRVRAGLLAGVALLAVSACRAIPAPSTKSATPSSTPTASAPTPTATPAVAFLPASPAPATPTPIPTVPLEDTAVTDLANQVQINLPTASLRLTRPPGWVALDSGRQQPWLTRLGADSLLLADSKDTGTRLLEQEVIGQGAFLLAMPAATTPKLPPDPGEALAQLLRLLALRGEILLNVHSTTLNGLPAAYADLPRDPLALFARKEENAHLRLILVYPPDAVTPLLLLLGAEAENWPTYAPTFDQILATADWQPGPVPNRGSRIVQGEIQPGAEVSGLLSNDQTDIWLFRGESGGYATLTALPNNPNIDLTLLLLTPAGGILDRADFGLPGEAEVMFDIPLPETGEYRIEVTEFFGETGRYALSLSLSATPEYSEGGDIALGQVITGELTDAARPVWTFHGDAGQLISIVLTPLSNQLDLIFELLGPDGQPLATKDETFAGDPEVLVGLELPLTGAYRLQIRSFSDKGGSYTLALDEGGESTSNFYDAGDLVYGNVKREMLRENEAHAWFFEGRAGDEVTVLVSPLGDNLDMDIWLLDPQVHRLAQKDENLSGETEMIEMVLPADGLYAVMVREFFGEAGEYEISITAKGYDNLEDVGSISYGQTVTGTLLPGKGAVWHFAGIADTEISLNLTPTDSKGDLVLILRDPQEIEQARVDLNLAGEAEQLRGFNLTSSGDWTIVVKEFFDEGGPYQLTLNRVQ